MDMLFDTKECLDLNCIHDGSHPKCSDEEWIKENCKESFMTQAIVVCYFALTTLSTIGYGDYYPISRNEKMVGIIFMLVGIVFFSQIMGSFIEII
jgi:hypothetical protein